MLRFPHALWLGLGLSVMLTAPSLAALHYCDDQLFILRLEGLVPAPRPGPFSLYTFAVAGMPDLGPFWWSSRNLQLALLRPFASALFALDHAIWGRWALPYHVHSVAWFVLAVILASALYRRLFAERHAALASIAFAVAPAHAMAVHWPAARHVVVAGALGFAALALHMRARERGRFPVGALAILSAGLLTSEIVLGAFGYILAYELVGRDDAPRVRARVLAAYGTLGAGYLGAYLFLGYGVRGSGDYVDPLHEPLSFLAKLPRQLGPLACSTFFGLPSELSVVMPRLVGAMSVAGVLAAGAFIVLLRRAMRGMHPAEARRLRWLLLGALLAIAPGLSGIVGDRILFLPSLGLSAAMAAVILSPSATARSTRDRARPLAVRLLTGAFFVTQLVLAPLFLIAQSASFASSSHKGMDAVSRSEIPRADGTRVYGIGIADPLIGMYLEPALAFAGFPGTETQMLSVSAHDHVVRRLDAHAIEVEVVGGTMLENGFETVVRARSAPLRAGDEITAKGLVVRIVADVDGRPYRFTATFDRELDDPSLVLLAWRGGALRRLMLPASGSPLALPHEVGPSGF